jgi:hypothetical protein
MKIFINMARGKPIADIQTEDIVQFIGLKINNPL